MSKSIDEKPTWLTIVETHIQEKYEVNPEKLGSYTKIKIKKGIQYISKILKELDKESKDMVDLVFRGEGEDFEDKSCTPVLFRDSKYKDQKTHSKGVNEWITDVIKKADEFGLIKHNIWEVFIKSRMVGVESPFVDFTKNFFVALFFACEGRSSKKGVVYFLESGKLGNFNTSFRTKLEDVELLLTFQNKLLGKHLKIPPSIDSISFAQDAYLIIWKSPMPDRKLFKKIIIKQKQKESIKLALKIFFNIDYSRLMPGFEGFKINHKKIVVQESKENNNTNRSLSHIDNHNNRHSFNLGKFQNLDTEEVSEVFFEKLSHGIILFVSLAINSSIDGKEIKEERWKRVLSYLEKDTSASWIEDHHKNALKEIWRNLYKFWDVPQEILEQINLLQETLMHFYQAMSRWDNCEDVPNKLCILMLMLRYFAYSLTIKNGDYLFYLLFHLILNMVWERAFDIYKNFFKKDKEIEFVDYFYEDDKYLYNIYNLWITNNSNAHRLSSDTDLLNSFKRNWGSVFIIEESSSFKFLSKIFSNINNTN